MSTNAIVIVQNSTGIALEGFARGVRADAWGRCLVPWIDMDHLPDWEEFVWENRRYFSLGHTPHFRWLGLYGFTKDGNPAEGGGAIRGEPGTLDAENPYHLTFLRAMLTVERLAGGPIYVGNDVVNCRTPVSARALGERFSLPAELDGILPTWRQVEGCHVDERRLVF